MCVSTRLFSPRTCLSTGSCLNGFRRSVATRSLHLDRSRPSSDGPRRSTRCRRAGTSPGFPERVRDGAHPARRRPSTLTPVSGMLKPCITSDARDVERHARADRNGQILGREREDVRDVVRLVVALADLVQAGFDRRAACSRPSSGRSSACGSAAPCRRRPRGRDRRRETMPASRCRRSARCARTDGCAFTTGPSRART